MDQAVEALNAKLAGGGFDGVAKFVIEGEGALMIDADGARAGDDAADVTLTADVDTFRAIMDGEINPTSAFMSGKLAIDGDMGAAMRLGSVLRLTCAIPPPSMTIWPTGRRADLPYGSDRATTCALRIAAVAEAASARHRAACSPAAPNMSRNMAAPPQSFADRGYAVVAIDWRGQGLSDRLIDDPMTGHVFDFGDYQSDVAALLAVGRGRGAAAAAFPGRAFDGRRHRPALADRRAGGARRGVLGADVGHPHGAAAAGRSPGRSAWAWPKIGRGEDYAPGTSATSYADTQPFEGNVLTNDPEMYAYMQAQTNAPPGPGARRAHPALAVSGADRDPRRCAR